MKVEHLLFVSLSEAELKESIICSLECEMSDLVAGTLEYDRRKNIIDHMRDNICDMEWSDDRFIVSIDGVSIVEDF